MTMMPSSLFGSCRRHYAVALVWLFVAIRLPASTAQISTGEFVCPYDYTVTQRIGSTTFDSLPIKLVRQSSSTVEFTVKNTWTNKSIGHVCATYDSADLDGGNTCAKKANLGTELSMDTVTAACSKSGTAVVRLYARDAGFAATTDKAIVPGCCESADSSNHPALEYLVVLNCMVSCDNPVPVVTPAVVRMLAPVVTAAVVQATCPPPDGVPLLVTLSGSNATTFELGKTASGILCTLVQASITVTAGQTSIEGELKPIGRSYNGHNWESYANDVYSTMPFDCTSSGTACRVRLVPPGAGRAYFLMSYSNPNLSGRNANARFLEKGTFGPTKAELDTFVSPVDWVRNQLSDQLPITSHRAFFRQRLTHWHSEPSFHTLLHTGPCMEGARYRKYTFLHTDTDRMLKIATSPNNSSKLVLSVDGDVRTIVNGPATCHSWSGTGPTIPNGEYEICWNPLEGVNGETVINFNGGCKCELVFGGIYGNPVVQFDDKHLPAKPTINLDGKSEAVLNDLFTFSNSEHQLRQVTANLSGSVGSCPGNDKTPGAPDVVIVGTSTGTGGRKEFWIHTASFHMENNDVKTPLLDGGKAAVTKTANAPADRMKALCSSAPRTFLNEDSCVLSADACHQDEGPDVLINLNYTTLERIYNSTGGALGVDTRYVYAASGLRIDSDSLNYIALPCMPGARSRWIRTDTCTGGKAWNSTTQTIFRNLLTASLDKENPFLRDVFFPATGTACAPNDLNSFGFKIQINGICFENQHPDNLQVYDFTVWTTDAHPGNKPNDNKIKKFADVDKTWMLTYPSWHDMNRWHVNKNRFGNLGRLGDNTTLKSLPVELLRESVARAFGSDSQTVAAAGTVMVCGSPFEVATVHTSTSGPLGKGGFDMHTSFNHTTWGLSEQRRSIWMHIALKAADQLRQRVAFALSQIVVISPNSIESDDLTESFLIFYDIFVRHAFGNYFDILKEVTFSPLMGE